MEEPRHVGFRLQKLPQVAKPRRKARRWAVESVKNDNKSKKIDKMI